MALKKHITQSNSVAHFSVLNSFWTTVELHSTEEWAISGVSYQLIVNFSLFMGNIEVWCWSFLSLTCTGKWFWCRQLPGEGKIERCHKQSHLYGNINMRFWEAEPLPYCNSSCSSRTGAGCRAGGRHRGCFTPSLLLQEFLHCGKSATRLLFWCWKKNGRTIWSNILCTWILEINRVWMWNSWGFFSLAFFFLSIIDLFFGLFNARK